MTQNYQTGVTVDSTHRDISLMETDIDGEMAYWLRVKSEGKGKYPQILVDEADKQIQRLENKRNVLEGTRKNYQL